MNVCPCQIVPIINFKQWNGGCLRRHLSWGENRHWKSCVSLASAYGYVEDFFLNKKTTMWSSINSIITHEVSAEHTASIFLILVCCRDQSNYCCCSASFFFKPTKTGWLLLCWTKKEKECTGGDWSLHSHERKRMFHEKKCITPAARSCAETLYVFYWSVLYS